MFADTIADRPTEDLKSYPTEGVTIGIAPHPQTIGGHRVRLHLSRPITEVLRRGLSWPRIQIDGSLVNGLRVWCAEENGLSPVVTKHGAWTVTIPVRRLRGREKKVQSEGIDFEWQRDETGPSIIIPRLPDAMLPEAVIEKLPNSQVDRETRMERADKQLQRAIAELSGETPSDQAELGRYPNALAAVLDELIEHIETPAPEPVPEPVPEPAAAELPPPPIVDLKDALAMVNELVAQLGDEVVLTIDAAGHVQAKRRVVRFIDL